MKKIDHNKFLLFLWKGIVFILCIFGGFIFGNFVYDTVKSPNVSVGNFIKHDDGMMQIIVSSDKNTIVNCVFFDKNGKPIYNELSRVNKPYDILEIYKPSLKDKIENVKCY